MSFEIEVDVMIELEPYHTYFEHTQTYKGQTVATHKYIVSEEGTIFTLDEYMEAVGLNDEQKVLFKLKYG